MEQALQSLQHFHAHVADLLAKEAHEVEELETSLNNAGQV